MADLLPPTKRSEETFIFDFGDGDDIITELASVTMLKLVFWKGKWQIPIKVHQKTKWDLNPGLSPYPCSQAAWE